MKMLISYLYCNLGGVTSVIKQRLPSLLKNGWKIDTAFMEDNGGKNDLLASGVNKVYIFGSDFKNGVSHLLTTQKYDLHVIIDSPSLLSLLDKNRIPKTVFEVHTSIESTIRRYPIEHLQKTTAIIIPSEWLKNTLLDIFPSLNNNTFLVVPNVINKITFSLTGKAFDIPRTMLWVGKFIPLKNWVEAIEIAGAFLQLNTNWHFTMVTGGMPKIEDVEYTLDFFNKIGKINRFHWLHNLNQDDMGQLYRGVANNGGFLLSTSKAESFCLVIHEAMRCGVPVVSSKIGPIPEVIDDGKNGLIYELGDKNLALSKCNLLLNNDTRSNIIKMGGEYLEKFDQMYDEDFYLRSIQSLLK